MRERVVVERGEGAVAERGEALLAPAQCVLHQRLRAFPRHMAVDAHALARRAAEEVVDGDAEPLPLRSQSAMSIPATALMITCPVDQNVPRTISLHQCSIFARVLADEQLGEVVEDAEDAAPLTGQARLADARQPLVGADEHDDHRVLVARPHTHG